MLTSQTPKPKIAALETKNALERQEQVLPNVNPKAVAKFLRFVAEGAQETAEIMLESNPAIALMPGDVTDLSKRTFSNITGFQYAVWALDWHMWTMIRKYLPDEAAQTQAQEFETGSWVKSHGVHAQWLLDNLTTAYQTTFDLYNASKYAEGNTAWVQQVGGAQLLLPAHVINEYCHPTRPMCPTPNFKDALVLPRSRKIDEGEWFTASYSGGKLGEKLGIYRGVEAVAVRGAVGLRGGSGGGVTGVVCTRDGDSVRALASTRITQRDELIFELNLKIKNSLVIEAIKKNNQNYFDNSCRVVLPITDIDGWMISPTNYATVVQSTYTSYSESIQAKKIQIQKCVSDSSTVLSSILLSTTLENFDKQLKEFGENRKTPLNILAHHADPGRIKGSDYLYNRLDANNQGVPENWTSRGYSIPLDVANILTEAKLPELLLMGEIFGIIHFDLSYRVEVSYSYDAETKFDIYLDCTDEQQKTYQIAIINVAGIIDKDDSNLPILKSLQANHVSCCNTRSLSPLTYERSARSHNAFGMMVCFPYVKVKKVEILPTVEKQLLPLIKNKLLDKILKIQASMRLTDLLQKEQVKPEAHFINEDDKIRNDLPTTQEQPAQNKQPITVQNSGTITPPHPNKLQAQKTYCPYFSKTALINVSFLAVGLATGVALEAGRRYYSKF